MVRFIYRYNIFTNQSYEEDICQEPEPDIPVSTTTTTTVETWPTTTITATPWLV